MTMTYTSTTTHMRELVSRLNQYRDEYYNKAAPSVSDAVYDRLYDELSKLEMDSGYILSNSPTQTVGYPVVDSLSKVWHSTPLLSLDKTKQLTDILRFIGGRPVMLMLKLDGLTVKLTYENGVLVAAATRGDGEEGEDITHNAFAFQNVPLKIPYTGRLVVTGEAFILKNDFEVLKETLLDSSGEPYKHARNLAAGSVRNLDAAECKERCVHFLPFSVLEGLDDVLSGNDSKSSALDALQILGFGACQRFNITDGITEDELSRQIEELKSYAEQNFIPIDGMVVSYDSIAYSKTCGRTGHHFKDGLAFKFEDDLHETYLKTVEWNTTRFGEIAPVAVFSTVQIDGCAISRASLHNLSFIKDLELNIGDRILVSKRNMIIPHVEDNLDRGSGFLSIPANCPCCGEPTKIKVSKAGNKRLIETLWCENPTCESQWLNRLTHFVSKKAMDIEGLSKATLIRLVERGWLDSFSDLYRLKTHRSEIICMEGFGEKSYDRLWDSIQDSRDITFVKFLVAVDIPMIGRTASRTLAEVFSHDVDKFEVSVELGFDFTKLPDFGETLHNNIHAWFADDNNKQNWKELRKMMNFERPATPNMEAKNNSNPFYGKIVVVTGKLEHFTRDSINNKIMSVGATAGSSISKNTDYLICGDKAGSKLDKARQLGVPVLTEQQFLDMTNE